MSPQNCVEALQAVVGSKHVLISDSATRFYRIGIKIGGGGALAVVLPKSLLEMWKVLQVCVAHDVIVIMQAANTGVTAGSTPMGDDYDREIVIVNTRAMDDLVPIVRGEQVLAFAGATLFRLEELLEPLGRSPHSVIGSSCIGASIVGGICNNSGGNLVNRGPAYTEFALFARLDERGRLELVNHLGLELGDSPEEILTNLQEGRFDPDAPGVSGRVGSDRGYQDRVRQVDAATPARFNADRTRLHEASGSAGKLAIFAVRVDTFVAPNEEQVFWAGTNDPSVLTTIRRRILGEFEELPEMCEYMHRSYFDASDHYCKDTFLFLRFFNSSLLPKLFRLKASVDGLIGRVPRSPAHVSDRVLQRLGRLWPDHLPKRLRASRDRYEHMLMIKANDDVIAPSRALLEEIFADATAGGFLSCTKDEGDRAILHRFVAGGASSRFHMVEPKHAGGLIPLDVALPRNLEAWHEVVPDDVRDQLAAPFVLAHFLCHVFHYDFVALPGVDVVALRERLETHLDGLGAKYPAEHNVGHLYRAEAGLRDFYVGLDPTNSFNAGVGQTSKRKHYA
ncbi:D-lactate dehydrogenase [uncultured Ilumatobacter sp.]|jgi:D-lactate dehydrogenase|uniref:D-lactate dehydrogenase n=1 Tax=uncultured Ilumatobacter sp. TaxID=879968 RepID=UPI00374F2AB6|tara:strand:- start:5806 stop:7497 length:1692 start_codon:yes stop_codon:yes gene_type:complete